MQDLHHTYVALFTRAWIEMASRGEKRSLTAVALFTRAWIEIINIKFTFIKNLVALFTRAWIEMGASTLVKL